MRWKERGTKRSILAENRCSRHAAPARSCRFARIAASPARRKVFPDVRTLRRPVRPPQLFVTTALPYANGPFHIGHIMEYIQADIWVRFQRMQGHEVHFVVRRRHARRADHAEGRGRGHRRPRSSSRGSPRRARSTRRLPHQLRPLALDRLAGERRAVAGHLPARCATAAVLIATKPVEQFYDPVKRCSCRTATSRASARSAARRTSTATPAKSAAPSTRRPTSRTPTRRSPARRPCCKSSEHFFFRLSDPACVEFLKEWTQEPGRLQPEVANKAQEWLGDGATRRQGARRLGHLARRALLRHPHSRRAGQVFLRLARRADRLPRQPQGASAREHAGIDFAQFLQSPRRRADPLHRQGHRLLPHAVLAGDAEVRRRRPTRCRTTSSSTASSPSPARRCRSRAAPASARDVTSTSASTPSGCAITSRRSSTPRSRTSTSTPTTSSRASTATSSASTSTSRAARARFIAKHFGGRLGDAADRAQCSRCAWRPRSARPTSPRALRGARVRQGDARDHALADRTNEYFDAAQALGARQGAGAARRLQRSARGRCSGFRCSPCILKPVLPRLARAVEAAPRPRRRSPGPTQCGRCRPRDRRLPAPHDPHRPEADRRALAGPAAASARRRRPPRHPRRRSATPAPGEGRSRRTPARSPSTTSRRSTCASRASSTPSTSRAPTSCSS